MHRHAHTLTLAALLLAPLVAHDEDPKVLDQAPTFAGPGFAPGHVLTAGSGSFFTGSAGLGDRSIEFPSAGVTLLSWMTPGELAGDGVRLNDCWGYVSPSGREYALVGTATGTAFVEISDPSAPVLIEHVDGPGSIWRDVKTYQDHAYSVSEGGGGIQVIDLSQIDTGVVTLAGSITTGGTLASHNVVINEDSGFLYRCGGAGTGIRVYSLANPSTPTFVGQWNSRYVHDAQVVSYTSGPYAGREIAFLCGGFNGGFSQTGLIVLDVTNKSNMFARDIIQYPQASYSHQCWISPDKQYCYLDDELDEGGVQLTRTHVFDISDLDDVQSLGWVEANSTAIGHNLYVRDDRIFEANYRSGLRVFDRANPAAPVEVAYFDTWPGDDDASFNGLWSCYPYFPSGVVIGSDVEKGLFVWWVGDPLLDVSVVGGPPALLEPAGSDVQVQIDELSPGDLAPGSERLWYDAGAGVVEVALTPLGGGLYEAPLPALACGTRVRWYVGARSTNGVLWSAPEIGAQAPHFSIVALSEHVVARDDFEAAGGWTVGHPGDTATIGLWTRGDPVGDHATPEDDHSPGGTQCWYTGATWFPDGATSLVSPRYDLSGLVAPVASMWVWFSNGAGDFNPPDRLRIWLSDDDGATWQLAFGMQSRSDTIGSWQRVVLDVEDWIEATDAVRVRVVVRNDNLFNTVEGAFDDFELLQPLCCGTSPYCALSPNSAGGGASIGTSGSTSVSANDLVLEVQGAVPGQFGLFFYGPEAAQAPLGDGTLCVGGLLQRLPVLTVDGAGGASWAVDLASPPQVAGRILAGSEWNFQFWFRDPPAGGAGFNLSNAARVGFCR